MRNEKKSTKMLNILCRIVQLFNDTDRTGQS